MNNKIEQFRFSFKEYSNGKKTLVILAFLFVLLLGFFLMTIFLAYLFKPWFKNYNGSIIEFAFTNKFVFFMSVVFFIMTVGTIVVSMFGLEKQNNPIATDERGVSYMKNATHGSARWMNKKETEKTYYVGNIKDTTTTIYGQLSDKGQKVVGKHPGVKREAEQNVLIIGSPGTGKSFGFVRTEIIQTVLRHESGVFTDPKGEMYSSTAQFVRDSGAKICVFDLQEPEYSDFWNCLGETIDDETERLDDTRLNEFVDIFMRNTSSGGKSEEEFWFTSAMNLLKACIGYCAWRREKEILVGYKDLYKNISPNGNNKAGLIAEQMAGKDVSFKWCKDQIRKMARATNRNMAEINKKIEEIEKNAPRYDIGEVFDSVRKFNENEDAFKVIQDDHPAKIAYDIFVSNSAESVRGSILQGLQVRMQIFSDAKIKNVLSHDGIDLRKINSEQTIVYVIMNDKSDATKAISSLFFSFLLKDAQENWDREQMKCNSDKPEDNPCLSVSVLLDEFFSIGIIGGNPNRFAITMSTARSRCLHIAIIIQSYPQIQTLYGIDNAQTIQTCCSTIIFLGCNDPETSSFISNLCGDATVQSESHKEMNGLLGAVQQAEVGYNSSASQRRLLTPDEVRRWKNKVLVIRRGELPLKLNFFPWIQHPCYLQGKMPKASIYADMEPLSTRLNSLTYEDNDDLYQNISKEKEIKVNRVSGEVVEVPKKEPVLTSKLEEKPKKVKPIETVKRNGKKVERFEDFIEAEFVRKDKSDIFDL